MPDHPAVGGEPILIYLIGVDSVNPAIADGTGDTFNPLITTVAQATVLIGGFPATVLFSGPTLYPGLHQINVTMPPGPARRYFAAARDHNVQRFARSGGHPGSAVGLLPTPESLDLERCARITSIIPSVGPGEPPCRLL